ncbi:MAG: hypothetical protein KKG49_16275 [Gammaproteobacteria bacterium]|nr:hypothetical protein [Gammaproteobacteria bacterium]
MSLIPKKGNVYVVDDDEAVRDAFRAMLGRKSGLARRWMKRHMVAIGG